MDLDEEIASLAEFKKAYFTPPCRHMRAVFELWELPPAIHIFRHRSELFLLETGLTPADIENLKMHEMVPSEIFAYLEKAHLYASLR